MTTPDGEMMVLGGFVATWIQIGILYYKMGKFEQIARQLMRKADLIEFADRLRK